MTATIEASGLRKRYGAVAALSGLDLAVNQGQIVGLLGPNGAGKTTALRILLGLVGADAGSVSVAGKRVDLGWTAGEQVGALVGQPVLYPYLSGRDNLAVAGAAWGWDRRTRATRVDRALALVDLATTGPRPVRGYSTGMRQRLAIALALLADPPLLILDEPANGLDPAGIVEVRDLLAALGAEGRTILVSSHLLTEVEKTCQHVTIVHLGRVVADGPAESLVAADGERIEVRVDPGLTSRARLALEGEGMQATPTSPPGSLAVLGAPDGSTVSRVLAGAGIYPDELARRRDSLEEIFLRLTGGPQAPEASRMAGRAGAGTTGNGTSSGQDEHDQAAGPTR